MVRHIDKLLFDPFQLHRHITYSKSDDIRYLLITFLLQIQQNDGTFNDF